jgi:HSP20 family molecular chaperone IbpA
VRKEHVDLGVTSNEFRVTAPREDFEYHQWYSFAHEVDFDKAEARFETGLLRIKLPLKESPGRKKIMVR